MNSIKIETYQQFPEEVRTDSPAVYRGQTRDYATLTPSFFRNESQPNLLEARKLAAGVYLTAYDVIARAQFDRDMSDRAVAKLEKMNEEFLHELQKENWPPGRPYYLVEEDDWVLPNVLAGLPTPDAYSEYVWFSISNEISDERRQLALLQHYGVPTPALDVSYDPNIALWFATHQFVRIAETQGRYQRRTEEGVVYVLGGSLSEMQDLRHGQSLPTAGLRGQRQVGALLWGNERGDRDLSYLILKKIFISAQVFNKKDSGITNTTQEYLFPTQSEDPFYQKLVVAKQNDDERLSPLARWIIEYV